MKKEGSNYLTYFLCVLITFSMLSVYLFSVNTHAQEEKITFVDYARYNPPPVGHFNFFVSGFIGPLANGFVLEPLTHYFRMNDTFKPGIAVSWEVSEDYKYLKVALRKGVKWHDGKEFTAMDVYANLLLHGVRETSYPFPFVYIKEVKMPDDYTIEIYMDKPSTSLAFAILWHFDYVPYHQYKDIVDKIISRMKETGKSPFDDPKAFKDIRDELLNFKPKKIIGTGPYKLVKITESEIILEKFKDYWNGEPLIDEVVFKRITSQDILMGLILKGQLDWYWGTPTPEELKAIEDTGIYEAIRIIRPLGPALVFNFRKYPLNIKEVRQAMAYAINRAELANIEWPIGGIPDEYLVGFANVYIPQWLNESFRSKYLERWKYEYNPSKAEQLLQQLGFKKGADGIYVTPNGTKLEFNAAFSTWLKPETAEALANQLAKVGIKLNIRMYDSATYSAEDGIFNTGQFDIGVIPHASPSFSFANTLVTQKLRWVSHGFYNYPELWKVPWSDKPINITELADKLDEPLPEKEIRNYVATLTYVQGENLLWIHLFTRPVIILLNKQKFTGWPTSMDYWNSLASYAARGKSYLFRWYMLKPIIKLTIEATTGGSVTPAPGVYKHTKGEKVTVKATPEQGYVFEKWELDGSEYSKSPTVTITMDKSHKLRAVFKKQQPPIALYVGAILLILIILVAIFWFYKKKKT